MRPSGAALDAKTQVETAFRRVTRPRSSHSGPLTASSGLPAQHPAPLQSRDLKPVHSWMGPRFRDLGHLVRRTRRTMPGSVPRPAGLAPRPLPDSHRACRTRTAPAEPAPRPAGTDPRDVAMDPSRAVSGCITQRRPGDRPPPSTMPPSPRFRGKSRDTGMLGWDRWPSTAIGLATSPTNPRRKAGEPGCRPTLIGNHSHAAHSHAAHSHAAHSTPPKSAPTTPPAPRP